MCRSLDPAAMWSPHRWFEPPIPIVVRIVDRVTANAMALDHDGAILVRRDGRPVARWSTADRAGAALRATVHEVVAGLPPAAG